MNRNPSRSLIGTLLAVILLLFASACAVPFAPGYRIVKMTREIQFIPGSPAALRVQGRYTLENSGTADLTFLDVNLPGEKLYGRGDLRIRVNSREIAPSSVPNEPAPEGANTLRVTFPSSWQRRERLDLAIDYTFQSPQDAGARIGLGPNNFHLGSRGWYPMFLHPANLLASAPARPDRSRYSVRLPSNFVILARGKPSKSKKFGDETEYAFELRKNDLPPFIAAGQYVVSGKAGKSGDAIFWTFEPLQQKPSQVAARIGAAWSLLQTVFGPLEKNKRPPLIVEATELRSHVYGDVGAASASFPGGALVNPPAIALGLDSEQFFDLVSHSLAHNWFGEQMFFVPDAALGMGEGLPEYATIVMEEANHGDAGRRVRIGRYIREYDEALTKTKEEPLGITLLTDPREQRRISLAKAPLFFIALEDACGEAPMRSGLAQMVALLRGQETDYGALRASLEQTSGKNLADIFRVWLNDKGLPNDFRARYRSPQENPGN